MEDRNPFYTRILVSFSKFKNLKESFSIVQQALRMSEMYNGGVDSWDTSLNGSQFFHT